MRWERHVTMEEKVLNKWNHPSPFIIIFWVLFLMPCHLRWQSFLGNLTSSPGPSTEILKSWVWGATRTLTFLKLLRDSNWQPSLQTLGLQKNHPRHRRLTFIPILNKFSEVRHRQGLPPKYINDQKGFVIFSLSPLPQSCTVPIRVSNSEIVTSKKLVMPSS